MSQCTNDLGQPIGFAVDGWSARPRPPRTAMAGRTCRVEPLDPERHAADLHAANGAAETAADWTYMAYGPFATLEAYQDWMARDCLGDDPLFHAVIERTSGRAVGVASYLRIVPAVGVIEVGHIQYAPALQRTVAATEAMALMAARVFDELGYRRYEWKCDALNARSRRAALRLGFRFEGVFRQATIYKGRNRDTAWFAITDDEWPSHRAAIEAWLDDANFDAEGRQRRRLEELRAG
jgi:RimJ/RimL family protein N-acetyltransferase